MDYTLNRGLVYRILDENGNKVEVPINEEMSLYKQIPLVSNATQQQAQDNYYQVKMEVKRLIEEEMRVLKSVQN